MRWIWVALILLTGCSGKTFYPPKEMSDKKAQQIFYACKHGAANYGALQNAMTSPQQQPYTLTPQGPIGPAGSGSIYAGAQIRNSSANMANSLAALRARQAANEDWEQCLRMNGFTEEK
jgi:hypothetical protein